MGAWGSSAHPPRLHEAWDELLRRYVGVVGGQYWNEGDEARVRTRVDDWPIVLEVHTGHTTSRMLARYESVDGFEFKVGVKRWFHDLGHVFGSRDVDIGDQRLLEHYSVEANDEDKVRRLLGNQKLRDAWFSCHEAGFRGGSLHPFLHRFATREHDSGWELAAYIDYHVTSGERALKGLLAVHDLVGETLRELADMGSASRKSATKYPRGGKSLRRQKRRRRK